jgi:Do/DeqQ family serine protease
MKYNWIKFFAASLIGGGLVLAGNNWLSQNETTIVQPPESDQKIKIVTTNNVPNDLPNNFVYAANNSVNSVVHIKTVSSQPGGVAYDPFKGFFEGNPYHRLPDKKVSGSGSGVIISKEGYIATNNHVIQGASEIEVTLNDKRTYAAELIGTDPTTDLALIKINPDDIQPIQYGNSDEVNIGEWVLAVGNPFNLTSTVTAGIVSAKGRNINILKEEYAVESFIQTDAAVNPGNSGGALVNTKGELIGINTAIASNTGSYTGYSFAVPVNLVQKVMSDLLKFGTVQRGLLGVKIQDFTQEAAKEMNIDYRQGVLVAGIVEKSGADDAGLKENDIILKVGAIEVKSVAELQEQISKFRPGDEVKLSLLRGEEILTKTVTLKNKNGDTQIIEKAMMILGAQFAEPSKEVLKELNIKNGVQIKDIEVGKLMREGVKKDFIITHFNHKPVNSKEQLEAFLKDHKGGVLLEGVYPNGSRAYYGFGL